MTSPGWLGPAPDPGHLARICADAYADAALAGAPMRESLDLIEPLREEAAAINDPYRLGRRFDAAVARSVGGALQSIIISLRDRYYSGMTDELKAECLRAFSEDPSTGRTLWLRRYSWALTRTRLGVCDALTAPGWLPDDGRGHLSGEIEEWRATLAEATRRAHRGEWHLVLPAVDRLLGVDLSPVERVSLLSLAARVSLDWLEDSAAAERYAQQALDIAPDDPAAVVAHAYTLMWQGDNVRAEELLRTTLAEHPDDGITHVFHTICALWWESPEVAESRALEGVGQAADEVALYQMLMMVYADPALFPERETRLVHAAAQRSAVDPDEAYDSAVDLGAAYRANGRYDRARELLAEAVALDPRRLRAYGEQARLAAAEEHTEEAASWVARGLAVDPTSAETMLVAVDVCDQQGKRAEGDAWLRRAAEEGYGNPGYRWAAIAVRQVNSGQEDAAWESAERAVAAAPDSRVCYTLGDVVAARWRTDSDSVRRLFARIRADQPEDRADLHNLMGNKAFEAGDYEAASAEYAAAAELVPGRAWYHRNRGGALRELQRWDEAEECISCAFGRDSDATARDDAMAALYNARANRCYEAANYGEAESLYRKATQLAPGDAVYWSNLSLALEEAVPGTRRTERIREAVAHLAEAARLAPDDGGYGVRLARLQTQLIRLDRFGDLIETPAQLPTIRVELADDITGLIDPAERGQQVFDEMLHAMRSGLQTRLGFYVSDGVRFRSGPLPPREFRIELLGVTRVGGRIGTDPTAVVEASAELMAALEQAIVDHAALFFGLETAAAWWREHGDGGDVRALTTAASREERRRSAVRDLAAARALRACVSAGIRLDQDVAGVIATSVAQLTTDVGTGELDHMALAAAAAERVRAAVADRSGQATLRLPAWAVEVAASGRPLSSEEEHRLLLETDHAPGSADDGVPLDPAAPWTPYLRRLLCDRSVAKPGTSAAVEARP